ncbi:MAG: CHAT domain-containing protein, partial [Deltaproteobacteria bacterium]
QADRIVIVPDGLLDLFPFAALPDPNDVALPKARSPLIARHELVMSPMLAEIGGMSEEIEAEGEGRGRVLVFADPAYGAKGSIVKLPGTVPPLVVPVERSPVASLEVRRLSRLLERRSPTILTGTEATAQRLLSAGEGNFDLLHLGVACEIGVQRPEFSFLALALRDEQGTPLNGVLLLPDIFGLRLPAPFLFLSGCRWRDLSSPSALPRFVEGWRHAGAEGMILSLWRVEDVARAAFVEHFYRKVVKRGLPPAQALREVQLAMRDGSIWEREARRTLRRNPWHHPYYWAGFVHFGEGME